MSPKSASAQPKQRSIKHPLQLGGEISHTMNLEPSIATGNPVEPAMYDDTRDRVIRLETELKNLSDSSTKAFGKIDHLYEIVMQGKGAVRLLQYGRYGAFGIGGYLLSKLPIITAWVSGLPK